MKTKIFLILAVLLLISCDPENSFRTFPRATVVNIDSPDELTPGQVNQIAVTFELPTVCHTFDRFQTQEQGNDITIETVLKFEGGDRSCTDTPNEEDTKIFEFFVENTEVQYDLRFLIGVTNDGQFIYDTINIPVASE
jgi:hypothetical protein